jgi:two-component system osmolarity sensor histidine kinase EnvZ
MLLKRFAPQSLYGRFLLIIIVPAVVVQLVATYMFYERHWLSVSRSISSSLAAEIAMVLDKAHKAKPDERAKIFKDAKNYLNLEFSIQTRNVPPGVRGKPTGSFPELEQQLEEYFNSPFYLIDNTKTQEIMVVVNRPKEQVTVTIPRKRLYNPTLYIYIMWLVGTGVILLVVSILFLKNQVRSIVRLADAADKFGKGQEVVFKPQGALEVRQAARAFIDMKERIHRQIRQRTDMLAGVSHDLRTPLTRMKLQLAMMAKDEQVKALEQDVGEMEQMVEGYLEFVRGGGQEAAEPVNLNDFFRQVVAGYRQEEGRITTHLDAGDVTVSLRPHAFRRCLTNLIDNALRYGKIIRLSTEAVDNHIEIIIEDDGPGIPPESREIVFQPFVRLETSRNFETGGVGLGLSIAQDVVHHHGGHIALGESPLGGLKVTISLPL